MRSLPAIALLACALFVAACGTLIDVPDRFYVADNAGHDASAVAAEASAPPPDLPDASALFDATTPAPPAPSTLSALQTSLGALSPPFTPGTTHYAVSVTDSFQILPFTVTATAASATASVTIDGKAASSGAPSGPIELSVSAPTSIYVVVETSGGSHEYVVDVTSTPSYATITAPDGGASDLGHVARDGDTLAIGADSVVYVFRRSGATWAPEARLQASNAGPSAAGFGWSLALSGDTLAVGAYDESSGASGIDGDQSDTSAPGAGAVYVFTRSGATWTQQAYVKASNARASSYFGVTVALEGDTMAVGAYGESSSATGIGGDQQNTSAANAGAGYVFARSGTTWKQQAYVKASNARAGSSFGLSVALEADTMVIGASDESSGAVGVGGDQTDTSANGAGAVYVFGRSGTTWTQAAYVKASNTTAYDAFGERVALSGDTLAVAAPNEASAATGVNGDSHDTSMRFAGAVYVFRRAPGGWKQEAYVKASNTGLDSNFGLGIALSGDALAVGAPGESSSATGIGGDQGGNATPGAGAVYVFTRAGATWAQRAYVKAPEATSNTLFGEFLDLEGASLIVGVSTRARAYVIE